jgi:hypothetical protein
MLMMKLKNGLKGKPKLTSKLQKRLYFFRSVSWFSADMYCKVLNATPHTACGGGLVFVGLGILGCRSKRRENY